MTYRMTNEDLDALSDYPDLTNPEDTPTVWIVAESTFERYFIRYVCATKEIALQKWEELRTRMITDCQDMVSSGYNDWLYDIEALQKLHPGEVPKIRCDYPDIKEWVVTE